MGGEPVGTGATFRLQAHLAVIGVGHELRHQLLHYLLFAGRHVEVELIVHLHNHARAEAAAFHLGKDVYHGSLDDVGRRALYGGVDGVAFGISAHRGVVAVDVGLHTSATAVSGYEALLPRREQVPGERYRHGERIRVYVVNVARGLKGPEIVVSRSHPELVRRLFEREVPELVSGAVSIMAIAREAGARTKIAVRANTEGVNPKGALIGPGGARVRAVMENLGPEKIDIVDWSADPAKFVAAALSPAVATGVQVISEKNKTAIAFIHDDQLSLAIGKEGQNARLAAKLTGWKIGIESAEAHAKKMAESADHSDGETEE